MSKLDKIDIHDEKGINFYCDYSSLNLKICRLNIV